ncbi:hypothetical protein GCM10009682_37950 [Luedemannella flava]|uniref:Peptidase S54 rhomboid domain-containing protein n=1 Tax=Luedemannella flava TaxID=349316 RepID=A0ABP4YE91_9ACTN
MSGIWVAGNAVVVLTSLVITSYLYHLRVPAVGRRWPWVSATIIAVTAVVTGLQFASPGLLDALRRDPDGLLDGEVWRLVAPLFVQPHGVTQVVLNGFLALIFLPVAERLYGNGLWLVYLGPGVVYQIVNVTLFPDNGGGSSTAIFGAMGAIHAYVLRHGAGSAPSPRIDKPFMVISSISVAAAVVLAVFRDGHGWGLLAGALFALAFLRPDRPVAGRRADGTALPVRNG